ncbi:MAG: hypothetical protein P4L87_11780, partial [Formivibrio sp.]|nr:hypothetical protein [Formivibrio sp.]
TSVECLEKLFGVMQLTSVATQEACVGALDHLAFNADKKVRGRMMSSGVLARVFAAMEAHSASAGVNVVGLGVVKNLGVPPELAHDILSRRGRLFLNAMGIHLACLPVQEAAFATLRALLDYSLAIFFPVEFLLAMLNQEVASMAAHVGSPAVQEHGCCTFASLLRSGVDLSQAFVSSGGLDRVHVAMEHHMSSVALARHACAVLLKLDVCGVSMLFLLRLVLS